MSTSECCAAGAFASVGACAAIRYWWFRNEPPNARLEEVVLDHVVGMVLLVQPLVDRQLGRVVLAHRQADRVASDHVAVLRAAVQLVLLLVELVHQVTRAATRQPLTVRHPVRERERGLRRRAGGRRRRDQRIDQERRVRERTGEAVRAVGARRPAAPARLTSFCFRQAYGTPCWSTWVVSAAVAFARPFTPSQPP